MKPSNRDYIMVFVGSFIGGFIGAFIVLRLVEAAS